MKKLLLATALAAFTVPTFANSSDVWFGDGVAWYQHPCGMRAFAKYGQDRSPEVRRAYEITKHDASQCEKLLP